MQYEQLRRPKQGEAPLNLKGPFKLQGNVRSKVPREKQAYSATGLSGGLKVCYPGNLQ